MPTLLRLFLVLPVVALILAGCGEGDQAAEATRPAETGGPAETTARVAEAFVPRADQFGVEQFKIVYDLEGQETGRRTMWIENYGAQVGIEDSLTIYGQPQHKLYYWDGDRSHMKDLPDGEVASTGLRAKSSEPTAFATTPAESLEQVGYERLGDKTIVGHTCEHWKNESFNYEGCRWNNIEIEFLNGAGTERILQRSLASAFVEGEAIPERIKALAQ